MFKICTDLFRKIEQSVQMAFVIFHAIKFECKAEHLFYCQNRIMKLSDRKKIKLFNVR